MAMDSSSTKTNPCSSWKNTPLLVPLFIAGVITLSLLINSNPTVSLSSFRPFSPPATTTDELKEVLEAASSGNNKTVIIAVVNQAYVEGEVLPNMLDLFLEALWEGEGTRELVQHFVFVAVDRTAYEGCLFRGLHCYRLTAEGLDLAREEPYMSKGFVAMMWRRTLFLTQVLKRGYNFIFTDTDVIWLRNPFPILRTNGTNLDIQFSVDGYAKDFSKSPKIPINTGFYYVKSSNKTVSLFEKWYNMKDTNPRAKEQDFMQNMTKEGVLNDLGIRVRYLDTLYFSGFCQPTRDVREVATVHANCCRFIRAKVADLSQILREWVQFRADPPNGTDPIRWVSKPVECPFSWNRTASSKLSPIRAQKTVQVTQMRAPTKRTISQTNATKVKIGG